MATPPSRVHADPALRLLVVMTALAMFHATLRLLDALPGPSVGFVEVRAATVEALRDRPPVTVRLRPTTWTLENERWRDVVGTAYGTAFCRRFRYDGADVRITYMPLGKSFRGWIEATGLKPNFAYQLKLRGDYATDPDVHRVIGYLGRWRDMSKKDRTNFLDYDYETAADKSQIESYILFDFFVTDAQGCAIKTFYLNSSLHVLWNSALNYAWNKRESLSRTFLVNQDTEAYGENRTPKRQALDIWAESQHGWQPSRPPVGQLHLPQGRYRCEVVLTEESFHMRSQPHGGHWATVMRAPVEFVIYRP